MSENVRECQTMLEMSEMSDVVVDFGEVRQTPGLAVVILVFLVAINPIVGGSHVQIPRGPILYPMKKVRGTG
jgi:hypothetical protein